MTGARTKLGRFAWVVCLALGGAIALAYHDTSGGTRAGLAVGSTLLAAAAVALGVALHRPRRLRGWALVFCAQVAGTASWVAWEAYLLTHGGAAPPPGGPADWFWIANSALLLGALLLLLLGAGRRTVFLDAAIVAAALGLAAYVFVISKVLPETEASLAVAAQLAYVALDVSMLAVVIRIALAGVRRAPSALLLAAAALALLSTDFFYTWLTLTSDYAPGAWVDYGWLLYPAIAGAAALHPSMAHAFERAAEPRPTVGRVHLAVLVGAPLVAPAVMASELLTGNEADSVVSVATVTVLSLLVVARLASLLRRSEALQCELAGQNERLRSLAAIVESSGDAIFSTTLGGVVRSWNAGAERMYGWRADEVLGRPVPVRAPADRSSEMSELLERVARGESVEDFETRRLARDGRILDVSLTVSPIRDEDGVVRAASAIVRDVSDRKRAEAEAEAARAELAAQNERLRELDRLKDSFVASVSHELRTPLTSIRGYLDLVLEGEAGELTVDQRRFLGVVNRNADRLLTLVGDLLFVAQVDAGKLTVDASDLDLAALARESVEAARPAAEAKEIALELSGEAHLPVRGDSSRLAQLLDNLVSNAIKFTPPNGKVDVLLATADGDALVEVADNGLGIPKDEQEQVFQRFFRASTANDLAIPGTGLGLAISRAIVHAHGGTIDLESEPAVGTAFRVALPLRAAAAPSPAPSTAEVAA